MPGYEADRGVRAFFTVVEGHNTECRYPDQKGYIIPFKNI
jgi:hypothetical protein